jgi:hypothetical protein
MEKETTTHYLHMQEDGQYITLRLPFTIMPNPRTIYVLYP